MGSMIVALVVLGIYPQPVIDTVAPVINSMLYNVNTQMALVN